MKTKRSFRILLVTAMACILSLFGLMAIACEKEPETKVPAGPEGGEYYYDANGQEYLITLADGNEFTFKVAGEERSGHYELAGTSLTLTFGDSSDVLVASLNDYNSMSFTYKDVSYTFLRKTTYTVHFDTDGAAAISDQPVLNGKSVAKPADPQKGADYLFVGWYTNKSYTEKYVFGSAVTGDLTLYARFVSSIPEDPEFYVSFEPGEGVDPIEPVETLQGKVYKLPEPVKEGDTFVGWWVSMTGSAEELSYRYNEQRLYENTTFYAVWESDLNGAPAVSVTADGVTWTGNGNNFRLTIVPPSGASVNRTLDVNSFAFGDSGYTPTVEGKYTVSVTAGDKTTTVYYVHKPLARVCVFTWEGNILQFNAVANATSYAVTIDCGTGKHTELAVDADGKAVNYYDFGECEMKPEGITFTVTASADGYVSSTSEPFVVERTLGGVEISVDEETQTVKWEPAENATSYLLTVIAGEETVFSGETAECTYSIKNLDPAAVKISIVPKAHGWNSPAATESTYQKTKLAVPTGLELSGTTLTWKQVNGATGYTVTVNGTPHHAESNSFELTEEYHTAGGAEITVVALAEDEKNNSPASDVWRVTSGEMGTVSYSAGVLSWDTVFGVTEYIVKVTEDGVEQEVTGTSFVPTLVGKSTTLYVRIKGETEWKSITVDAYEISFDLGYDNPAPASIYKAEGDPIALEEAKRFGYDFAGWYNGLEKFELSVFAGTVDLKLTAHWTPHKHTITFDVDGGSDEEMAPQQVDYGSESYHVPTPTPNQAGYAFEGWYTQKNGGGDKYFNNAGDSCLPYNRDDDIKLFANFVSVLEFKQETGGTYSVSKNAKYIGLVSEVTVPDSYLGAAVTVISDFTNCSGLIKLRIPATITMVNLGETAAAFSGCTQLQAVEVYSVESFKNTPRYYSQDGVLFSQDIETAGNRTLVYYPERLLHTNETYTIPDDVVQIGEGAFYNHGSEYDTTLRLQTLNIPASVSRIAVKAFHFINSLEQINFLPVAEGKKEAASLTIEEDAFEGSSARSVTSLTFPKRLKSIDPEILIEFRALTFISVEEGNEVYTSYKNDGILYRKLDGGSRLELAFYPRGIKDTTYTIESGVYSVGEGAFKNFTTLETLIIPGHVTNIANSAFEGCTRLESIEFNGTATDADLTIGDKAFYGFRDTGDGTVLGVSNQAMTELVLSPNIKSIGNMAFARLTKLTTVWVNASGDGREEINYATGAFVDPTIVGGAYVTTVHIGKDVPSFSVAGVFGSKLREVFVEQGSSTFHSDDKGVLYNAEMTELLFFPVEFEGAYEIPKEITTIADNMFAGAVNLEAVVIHENVTYIGKNAFNGCTGLSSVTIKEGGKELVLGDGAFWDCSALRELVLPEHLTEIGKQAFRGCKNLEHINIPASVRLIVLGTVSSSAEDNDVFSIFEGCDMLSEITVAAGNHSYTAIENVIYSVRAVNKNGGVEYVADALLYCPANVTGEIHVPDSVRRVAKSAFDTAKAVEKITFADLVATDNVDEDAPDTNELTLGEYAFQKSSSLNEIHFPVGLKVFTKYSIVSCPALQKINVPKSVTSIAPLAFYNLSVLSQLIFDEGGTEELKIEDTVKNTGGNYGNTWTGVFSGHKLLTSVTFPERLTYLGSNVFTQTNSTGSVTADINYIQSVTFTQSTKFRLEIADEAFNQARSLTSVSFAEGLISIGEKAFTYCSGLTQISLPASLTSIGNSAFSNCSKLSEIIFAEESQLTEIQSASSNLNGVFCRTAVERVKLPASLEVIGAYAFADCTALTTVEIPENNHLTEIGGNAFSGCTSFANLTFGKSADGVELTFGESSFKNCVLTKFDFPANTVAIGTNAFFGSARLTQITFEVDPETGKSALTSIGDGAFQKTALSSVNFPETAGDLMLGANLFKGCKNLTDVYLSTSVADIGGLLNGCGSIQRITIAEGNEHFTADGEQPIIYDSEGKSIMLIYADVSGKFTIATGATEIAQSAFANQASITEVHIPASVNKIGAFAFENCINLQKVVISDEGSSLTFLGKGAFHNCVSLTSVNLEVATMLKTIEANVTVNATGGTTSSAGAQIFTGCTSLDSIKFPASLEGEIYRNSTNNANGSSLDRLFEKSPVKHYDFSDCTKLTYLGYYMFEKSEVVSVKLPTTIEAIGKSAFDSCANLTTITSGGEQEEGTVDLSGLTGLKYFYEKLEIGTANYLTSTSTTETFEDCVSIRKVKLPAGIKMLGGSMFEGCTNLTTVEGLENVEGLAASEIFMDTAITSATIGEKVTTLGSSMFQNCASLSTLTFTDPSKITKIGGNFIRGCANVTSFDLTRFTSLAGQSSPFSGTYPFAGSGIRSIDLSGFTAMKSLVNYMFMDCTKLEEVKLPTSLTFLGTYTFQNCTSLKRINSDEDGTFDLSGLASLKMIGTSATAAATTGKAYTFDGCESLQKVILPASCTMLTGYVFINCTSLNSIDLSNVTSIGTYCFSNTGFTEVLVGTGIESTIKTSSVTSNVGEGVYYGCKQLKKVTFQEGLKALGNDTKYIFAECPELETVILSSTIMHLGSYTFENDVKLSRIAVSESALQEGVFDFNGTQLTRFSGKLSASKSVVSETNVSATVDSHIFAGCLALKEVKLPATFVQVGGYAFAGCENLAAFDFTNITHIGNFAFENTGFTEVTFGAKIGNVFYDPFENCKSLTAVTITENSTFTVRDGVIVNTKTGQVVFANKQVTLGDEAGGTLVLAADVKTLNDYAFYGVQGITKLDLSATKITTIPQYAFAESSITELVLPTSVKTLAANAFTGANIQNLDLSGTDLTTIAKNSFLKSGVNKVILSDKITSIADSAFQDSSLNEITLPTSLTTIGNHVFQGTALKTITIPKSVTKIGHSLFTYCKSLEKVVFESAEEDALQLTVADASTSAPKDESDTEATRGLFEYSAVSQIDFGNREFIKDAKNALVNKFFANTKNLKQLQLPANMTVLGDYAFYGSGIQSITIPASITTVKGHAFNNCTDLVSVTFESADTTFPSGAYGLFQGCTKLTNVDLGNRFTVLDYSFFEDCTTLQTLVIPEGVKEINGSFKNCTALSSLTLPQSLETISSTRNTFENTPMLKKLVIPENVATIGSNVFFGMNGDQTVCFTASRFVTAQLCGMDWLVNSDANFEFGYTGEVSAPDAPSEEALEAPVSKKYSA